MSLIVQNIDIFVKEAGHGEPILFLHGVPDSADIWDGITAQLQSNYHCIAPDWPSFGRSGSGAALDCSLDGHANFVNDLADALGLDEPFNLVGHDFGGVSVMAFVAKYPDRVRRLAVSNAPFSPDYRWHLWAKVWRTPGLGELSMAPMNRWIFTLSLRQGSRKLSDNHIRAVYRYVTPEMKRMILRMYRALPETVWQAGRSRLQAATARVPTIVLWGQHDPYLPNWLPDQYGAQEIRRYPEAGHWVPAEEIDAVAKDLFRFFAA